MRAALRAGATLAALLGAEVVRTVALRLVLRTVFAAGFLALVWLARVTFLGLEGFFLAGLSTFMSSWDRYRWRTIGIVAGIYVLELIIKIVGLATDQLSWMLKLTFFAAYEPERFVSIAYHSPNQAWSLVMRGENGAGLELGPLGYDLLLIGLGLIAYLLAALIFRRRDLPAPV